jgi:hypothetical protein
MATYIRRKWPASEALSEAMREQHVDWRTPASALPGGASLRKREASEERPAGRPQRTLQKELSDPKRPRKGPDHGGPRTVSVFQGGDRACKPFNDGRERDGSCGNEHSCDVQLTAGGACRSKKHTRSEHIVQRHG